MVKIHGVAYLIIGILVTATSYYLDKRNDETKLILFLYIGLVMIAIGIVKIVFKSLRKEGPAKLQTTQQRSQYCQFCGAQINYAGAYCHFCGGRIR